jgi:hypothetical protein
VIQSESALEPIKLLLHWSLCESLEVPLNEDIATGEGGKKARVRGCKGFKELNIVVLQDQVS